VKTMQGIDKEIGKL